MARSRARARPGTSLDRVLAGTALVLSLLAGASLVARAMRFRTDAPALDLALDALTLFVSAAVVALTWLRYRAERRSVDLHLAAAFLVLAVANAMNVGLVAAGLDGWAGMSLATPGQAPLYVYVAARIAAGAVLVAGGIRALRGGRVARPVVVAIVPAAALVGFAVAARAIDPALPPLASVPGADTGAVPTPTALGALVAVAGAALFLLASALWRRLYFRNGPVSAGYLAVGLVIGAFAQLDTVFFPGVYTGLVTAADVLRLAFDVTLLLGIQAEATQLLVTLRRANADLERLRAREVERAAIDERARLARELHDGLAQDLWLAKLKAGRLAAHDELDPDARTLAGEIGGAIDTALSNAQQAVTALRLSAGGDASLPDLLRAYVDDFADRFGLRVEFECDPGLPSLDEAAQAQALRIVQEALNNVRRHADATVVRIRAAAEGEALALVVRDNGRGFDPAGVTDRAFGLASMQERAALIGARLHIDSRPHEGTRVVLVVPLPATAITA